MTILWGLLLLKGQNTDSVHLLKMKEDLEVARLNEANLRMEIRANEAEV